MMQTQTHLNASRKLAPPPARRSSDYDWWDTPDDIDDDWHPPREVNDRGWLEAFGLTVRDMVIPPEQHPALRQPSAGR